MVNESLLNMTAIGEVVTDRLVSSMSPLITIFKAVGIILLIYLIFMLIRALFRWRTSFRIGKIAKNVQQINNKLDILVKRTKPVKPIQEKVKLEKKKEGKK